MTRRVGRPSKMTEETKNKLMQALIGCCTEAEACAYAEIDQSTYDKWKARARKDAEAGKDTEFVRFFRDIARARAKAKPRLIMLLSKAAERDPRTTLAILERRYPKEWGVRQYVETRDRTGEPELRDEDVLPLVLDVLDEAPELKEKLLKRLEELK
jgi:hypothetical protein